jgi:hypothetical protein
LNNTSFDKTPLSIIENLLVCIRLTAENEEGQKAFSSLSFEDATTFSNFIENFKSDESLVYSKISIFII